MDELVAAAKAEDSLDLGGLATHDPGRVDIGVGNDPARNLDTIITEHTDRIATLKPPACGYNTRRQQTLPFPESLECSPVDRQGAGRLQRPGNPLLASRNGRRVRNKPSASR